MQASEIPRLTKFLMEFSWKFLFSEPKVRTSEKPPMVFIHGSGRELLVLEGIYGILCCPWILTALP
eukprot:jgi/Botrbrau1/14761/Bobra.0103s0011.1